MKKFFLVLTTALLTCLYSFSVLAGAGNGAPSGPHYNLNIIGVEKGKEATMTGSNRHTIFVPLKTSPLKVNGNKIRSTNNNVVIETQIWLAPGDDFRVCDGNGFDEAYACADNPFWNGDFWNLPLAECETSSGVWEECGPLVSRKMGAVFELPCNNHITDDQEAIIYCDEFYQDTGLELPQSSYAVWARVQGSPKNNPSVTMTTCATVQDELQCSTENYMQTRMKGNRPFEDVTDALTSMVVDLCIAWEDDVCIEWETTRIALFSGDTEDWFWNYANDGVRLLQLRFYDYP